MLSRSRIAGTRYLEQAHAYPRSFLNARVRALLSVAYARVARDYDEYTERLRTNFAPHGYVLTGLHRSADPMRAIAAAEALVIGGGNPFHLLRELYTHYLRERAGRPALYRLEGRDQRCLPPRYAPPMTGRWFGLRAARRSS